MSDRNPVAEKRRKRRAFIVGCAGIPAAYGGFETLAENLVLYGERYRQPVDLTVFCSSQGLQHPLPESWHGAHLRYLSMSANGVSSVIYDIASLLIAVRHRADTVLVLGVSGAIALPLVRWFSRVRIVTNIDGIEWRRAKWKGVAKIFLRFSEHMAVRFSHEVIADNQAVADYVQSRYARTCSVIAYGGDHAVQAKPRPYRHSLPPRYALALCRIEPENNVEMILEAFAHDPSLPLVFVGNWNASEFGRRMRERFQSYAHLLLADPEYDLGALYTLRRGASLYVHGHSAGGTNPSLVEAMHFGLPVAALDCDFNRHTTENQAMYFTDTQELAALVRNLPVERASIVGCSMKALALRHYTWDRVGAEYFRIL